MGRKHKVYHCTKHAITRFAQRGIGDKIVTLALRYGIRFRANKAIIVFVRKKDIPAKLAKTIGKKLEGTTLIMSPDGTNIITAYKNPKAMRMIKSHMMGS